MKSRNKVNKKVENNSIKNYPCLGITANGGTIVLFTKEKTGVVVSSGNSLGDYSDCWNMSHFKLLPSNVEITLSN